MKKILISYFSASGKTRRVAEEMATILEGDLFEIEPAEVYTKEDLNWMDSNSRSSIEMKDKTFRPVVSKKVDHLQDYDTVVIGFPVWWYTAPTIINTFLEENDMSGKELYVFVTSGGTGVEGTLRDLKNTYPNLQFVDGKRIQKVDENAIKSWILKI